MIQGKVKKMTNNTHLLFSRFLFECVIGFNMYLIIVMSLILDTTCFTIFVVENDLPMTEQIRIDNKGLKPTHLCC